MRIAVRATAAGLYTIAAVGLMMATSTVVSIFTAVAVAATTALIMGYTGHSLSPEADSPSFVQQWMGVAGNQYISPSSTATPATGIPKGPYNQVAVVTPEQFLMPNVPNSGPMTFDQSVAVGLQNLHNCISATDCDYNPDVGSTAPGAGDTFVVFGYSQSATIGTLEKRRLAAEYPMGDGPIVSFVFMGNGNRPNGGYLARGPLGFTIPLGFTFGGATFSGPTPTNTQYYTADVAGQYDPWADTPLNPFNLLAYVNASMGTSIHQNYGNVSLTDPGIINQGQYGDTTYYLIPTPLLPVLQPVDQVPVIGHVLADALDAPLRVIVESAYDRTISPGQPARWSPLYFPNPIAFTANLAISIPTAFDNALEDTIGIRPFGTQRPGPYGVGGPDVTYVTPPDTTTETQSTAIQSTAKTTDTPMARTSSVASDSSSSTTKALAAEAAASDVETDANAKGSDEKPTDSTEAPESKLDEKPAEDSAVKSDESAPDTATDEPATPATSSTTTGSSTNEKPAEAVSPSKVATRQAIPGARKGWKAGDHRRGATPAESRVPALSEASETKDSTTTQSEGDSAH